MSLPQATRPPGDFDARQIFLAIVGFMLVQVVASRLGPVLLPGFGQDAASRAELVLMRLALPTAATLAWVWFVAVWREPAGWAGIGIRPIRPHWLRWSLFAGLASLMVATVVAVLTRPWVGGLRELPSVLAPGPDPGGTFFLAAVLAGAVLAPLAEEMVFRGVLYGWLRRRWPVAPAVLAVAAAHALLHGDETRFLPLFAVFCIFTLLYEKAGSLWAPVLAHGVHNLATLLISYAGRA